MEEFAFASTRAFGTQLLDKSCRVRESCWNTVTVGTEIANNWDRAVPFLGCKYFLVKMM